MVFLELRRGIQAASCVGPEEILDNHANILFIKFPVTNLACNDDSYCLTNDDFLILSLFLHLLVGIPLFGLPW